MSNDFEFFGDWTQRGNRSSELSPKVVDDEMKTAAYFECSTTPDASAAMHRLGNISHERPASVRQRITEVTWYAKRLSPTIRAYFQKITGGRKERRVPRSGPQGDACCGDARCMCNKTHQHPLIGCS